MDHVINIYTDNTITTDLASKFFLKWFPNMTVSWCFFFGGKVGQKSPKTGIPGWI